MSMGRKPADNVRIYKHGSVRLPANFNVPARVKVEWEGNKLILSPARRGEIGLKPYIGATSKSAVINLFRVFRLMGLRSEQFAGEYDPVISGRVLTLSIPEAKTKSWRVKRTLEPQHMRQPA